MGVNIGRLRKFAKSQKDAGGVLQFEIGETLLYVHSQCREDDEHEPTDGLNLIPITQHYSIGPENKIALGLDPETNPIIEHPFITECLRQLKRKITLTGECPILAAIESGELSDEEADESKPTRRFVYGMTPLAFRKSNADEWSPLSREPGVAIVGKMISEGILDQYLEQGDISDPDAAVFIRILKSGKGLTTKYQVKPDGASLKKPAKLDRKLRAKLAVAMKPGGSCDLFKFVASMIKSPEEIEAALAGVPVSNTPDDDDEDVSPRRTKRRRKSRHEPEPDVEELDEEEDEDEVEEEEEQAEAPRARTKKRGKRRASAKVAPPEDEEDDDEEDDDDDLGLAELERELDDEEEESEEEEEDEPVRPRKKAARKKARARRGDA